MESVKSENGLFVGLKQDPSLIFSTESKKSLPLIRKKNEGSGRPSIVRRDSSSAHLANTLDAESFRF